jgi:hypothetical protein
MVSICKDRGQKFLSSPEYKRHQETHLQTGIDKWGSNTKTDKVSWKASDGLNTALYKVFERYNVGNKAMLCLYRNGQLNTAIREDSRILELQDRLKEWLEQN